jgi:hypothetical protein
MREILFKAKRIDNGEWVESESILKKSYSEIHYLYLANHEKLGRWIKCKPENVCQYTGLTDKNGNKIWEGDLMGGGHLGFIAAVTFNDGMFQLVTSAHQGNSPLVQDRASRIKVLGNIFDNPELLTK